MKLHAELDLATSTAIDKASAQLMREIARVEEAGDEKEDPNELIKAQQRAVEASLSSLRQEYQVELARLQGDHDRSTQELIQASESKLEKLDKTLKDDLARQVRELEEQLHALQTRSPDHRSSDQVEALQRELQKLTNQHSSNLTGAVGELKEQYRKELSDLQRQQAAEMELTTTTNETQLNSVRSGLQSRIDEVSHSLSDQIAALRLSEGGCTPNLEQTEA